jgi:hypothetical protein
MNLSNRIFLFINCSLRVVFSLFPKFSWVTRCEMGPRWPIYLPPLYMLAVDKLHAKHAQIKYVYFSKYFTYAYKKRINNLAHISAVFRKWPFQYEVQNPCASTTDCIRSVMDSISDRVCGSQNKQRLIPHVTLTGYLV